MKISTYGTDGRSAAQGVEVVAVEEGSAAPAGVGATWIDVAPGARSEAHQHDETETWVFVAGTGELTVDGERHPVSASSIARFEPFETHSVHNTGDTPLLFVSFYWRDGVRAVHAANDTGHRGFGKRPLFVFSSAPTPNGDLHLGHLSGPFFGADVFVRHQRMLGAEAWHITGSDDYQNYVVAAARREGRTPAQTAAHYSAEILATLELMDIDVHRYTATSRDADYPAALRAFFSRLTASGVVAPREGIALFAADTGEYLYESGVSGDCPACGSESGGNVCEACLEPNVCTDLIGPRSAGSDVAPREGAITRYTLPLHELGKEITEHHRLGRVPAAVQELAERLAHRERLDIPLTHPAEWGVAPAESDVPGQVIWSWLDYAFSILYGIGALGRDLGRDWDADAPDADWKIVHFLGSDGSFFHPMFIPALYRIAHPQWSPDIDYHINEFYLLEDSKFSTSRGHAIWGKDVLNPRTVDSIRFYLALTRPEGRRTSFAPDAYESFVRDTLVGGWQHWLNDLGDRVAKRHGGAAPDAGVWRPEHAAFLARLEGRRSALTGALGQDGFSLNRAAELLNGIVEDVTTFARRQAPAAEVATWKDEARTTIALELAAARLLATCVAPVMPRFANRLSAALGGPAPTRWPTSVDLLPAGTAVDLTGRVFFAAPEASEQPPDRASNPDETNRTPGRQPSSPLLPWFSGLVRELLRLPDDEPVHDKSLVLLGMESLQAIALQYRLTEQVDADVSIENLLGAHTVAELSALIERGLDPEVVAAHAEVRA
ncbi:class I tRNA ligase family protein [Embleya sp. NPDC005575]|uniref:class I tRNA ligase family protein n=1 Tax=Embleya sp. NPDC005575 TaxID=3156892 RepID=UPI0033BE345F